MSLAKQSCVVISVYLFVSTIQCAGTLQRTTRQEVTKSLDTIVKQQFGRNYEVAVEIVDSLLGSQRDEGDEITDPYGTLRGCILFSGVRYYGDQDSSFFGVYRDGRIIWTSDRIINGVWGITFATQDINKDGKVEILTTWYTNGDPRMEYMWIFSWDGNKGEIINQVKISGEDVILGGSFKLVAHDSSGVRDIASTSQSKEAIITTFYRWDGAQYVYDREIRRSFDEVQEDH